MRLLDMITGRSTARRPGWTYLQPADSSTQQQKWDDQIALNRTRVLGVFPRRTARKIADRMEACPNNPRNGGDGYDQGDGTWVDRRPGR